ncbi:hypothetical protein GCM10022224_026610 [Nonomuraea antimicrobica]|uniref:Uncharacterized protein n=1 Tax=Nonomuraea antimicrobica TaxID=561173 RepID=A0ABP7BKA5_9ACTN
MADPDAPGRTTPRAFPVTGPEKVRLSLDPDLARRGAVDGAWWPVGYDAGAELPGLIAAIDQRLNRRVPRVGPHIDAEVER